MSAGCTPTESRGLSITEEEVSLFSPELSANSDVSPRSIVDLFRRFRSCSTVRVDASRISGGGGDLKVSKFFRAFRLIESRAEYTKIDSS